MVKQKIRILIIMLLLGGGLIMTAPASAQAQSFYVKRVVRNGKVRYVRVAKPSFYRRHRNRVNLAIGTGGGAVLGGLLGGRKGALIGAGVGAGSSALYTYVWNKKTRKYIRVRRNRY